MDFDCLPRPGWFDALLPHLADPTVTAVAPRIVADGPGSGLLGRSEASRSSLDMGPGESIVRPGGAVPYVPSAALLVRRSAVGAGFDQAMRVGEDVDLVWPRHLAWLRPGAHDGTAAAEAVAALGRRHHPLSRTVGLTVRHSPPERSVADVIVVGAGAAGAALAARLSEDAGRTVLLLDSGPVPRRPPYFPFDLLDARLVPGAQPDHPAVRRYAACLTPGRPWTVVRGRYLGGSTTVNGGYFVRARREDFDRWSAAGNPAWRYQRVLPFLRTLETDLDYGASDLHGGSGPVRIRRAPLDHPAALAFRAAAEELGHPSEPDKNDQAAPGFGPVPSNSVDGLRLNTGISYLLPALDRPNLGVVGDCEVHRVVIRNGRATGVVARQGGQQTVLRAGEVVLCAGAFATPQLLQLSGIGPRAELERLGIPVVTDAPAVGRRFSDHPQVVVEWAPRRESGAPADSWLGGCLHLSSSDRSRPGDLEILQSLVPMAGLVSGTVTVPDAPLAFLLSVQTPRSTGRLTLRSADPTAPPRIAYGYLAEAHDRRLLREAVRATAELIATDAFRELSQGLLGPGPEVLDSDDALDAWARRNLGTAHHTCGTAPMGSDERHAAVDQYGRVHGVQGLRVADTSVLPTAPLRGPAATAVLVGEIVADAMRRELS